MSDIGELFDLEIAAGHAAFDRRDRCLDEHGYGCGRAECGRSESARLVGLDASIAVPRPVPRPDIERYLRVTVDIPGGSIEAGMQRTRGEPLRLLRSELARVIADEALVLNGADVDDDSAGRLINAIEDRISRLWPGRAWFAEVWQADEALSQVYAPYGMPRAI